MSYMHKILPSQLNSGPGPRLRHDVIVSCMLLVSHSEACLTLHPNVYPLLPRDVLKLSISRTTKLSETFLLPNYQDLNECDLPRCMSQYKKVISESRASGCQTANWGKQCATRQGEVSLCLANNLAYSIQDSKLASSSPQGHGR